MGSEASIIAFGFMTSPSAGSRGCCLGSGSWEKGLSEEGLQSRKEASSSQGGRRAPGGVRTLAQQQACWRLLAKRWGCGPLGHNGVTLSAPGVLPLTAAMN